MMTFTLNVRSVGKRKPLLADWAVPFPPEFLNSNTVTLRDLISRVVRNEVEAYNSRQRQNQFVRALTQRQIDDAALKGKIDMGGKEEPPQFADAEKAVSAALQAFEDGIYLVLINDAEQRFLDAKVLVEPDSRVTFLRLTMLAGG